MMQYTDSQMILATQIAYLDFDTSMMAGGPIRVGDILESQIQNGSGYEKQYAEYLLYRIENDPACQVCADWKIVDVRNDQHGSGMYACLLETGQEEALIAFRGSESDTGENVVKDWVLSDFGLLNSVETPQQKAAGQYTEDLFREYGDKYKHFATAGHSLGGNLAEHAAVTAPEAMRPRLTQCGNLDGPGYSHAYILAHAAEIAAMTASVRHVQWSLVGTLLEPLPGTTYHEVKANTPDRGKTLESLLWRHDTMNVVYDSKGNLLAGSKDILSILAGPFSKTADRNQLLLSPSSLISSQVLGLQGLFRLRNADKKIGEAAGIDVAFSGGASPELELEPDACETCFSDMEEIGRRIRSSAETIRDTSSGFSNLSGGGLWQLQQIRGAADTLIEKTAAIRRYAAAGQQAAAEIRRADRTAAAIFEG